MKEREKYKKSEGGKCRQKSEFQNNEMKDEGVCSQAEEEEEEEGEEEEEEKKLDCSIQKRGKFKQQQYLLQTDRHLCTTLVTMYRSTGSCTNIYIKFTATKSVTVEDC